MIEQVLQLVADTLDGTLNVYDDGYVVDVYLAESKKAEYYFDLDGVLQNTKIKKN